MTTPLDLAKQAIREEAWAECSDDGFLAVVNGIDEAASALIEALRPNAKAALVALREEHKACGESNVPSCPLGALWEEDQDEIINAIFGAPLNGTEEQ